MRRARCFPAFALLVLSACSTVPSVRSVSPGEQMEVTAGFDESDVQTCVCDMAMRLGRIVRQRCLVGPGRRLPVEIRPFACEGFSSGQAAIGKSLASHLEEELTNGGLFFVVSPIARNQSEAKPAIAAQYRIDGEIIKSNATMGKNVIYVDYRVKVRLVDLSSGGEVFVRNIKIRKRVTE